MGVYFSMVAENGENVISRTKLLTSNIFSDVLKKNGDINKDSCMELDKEYFIDITDIPLIIEKYENLIIDKEDYVILGEVGLIRHSILPSLREQLDYQVSKHRKYVIKLD